jgi:tRNA pseudouridine55 synthase
MKLVSVSINEIEFLTFNDPILQIRIKCSKGTYIRSLARDIGTALNSGAYLANLRRTKSGDFQVDQALKIEDFILTQAEPLIA